jgi:hypothetical protein
LLKTASYAFRNKGGYMFNDESKNWGIVKPTFSTGGVYADLDNDGDMDLVINNIDDNAFVYENTLNTKTKVIMRINYLKLSWKVMPKTPGGIGATIRIYYQVSSNFTTSNPAAVI